MFAGNKKDTNADGKVSENDGQKVNDEELLPSLRKTDENGISQATTSAETTEALGVMKYAADNTDVEWSVQRYDMGSGEKYTIATMHDEDHSPSYATFGIPISTMRASVHSHPGVKTTVKAERSSIGYTSDGSGGGTSDWQKSIRRYNKYGKDPYSNYVYFPESGNFYRVTPWE